MNTFTCEICHQTFRKNGTPEDVKLEEFAQNFPGRTDIASCCDGCYQKFVLPRLRKLPMGHMPRP